VHHHWISRVGVRGRVFLSLRFLNRQLVLPVSMDVAVVGQNDRAWRWSFGVAEHCGQSAKAKIGCDQQATWFFVELLHRWEQPTGRQAAERQVAQLIG